MVGSEIYVVVGLAIVDCSPEGFGDKDIIKLLLCLSRPIISDHFVPPLVEESVAYYQVFCGRPVLEPLASYVAC